MKMSFYKTISLGLLLLPVVLLLFVGTSSLVSADHNGVRNEHPTHSTRDPDPCDTSDGLCFSIESPLVNGVTTIEDLIITILNVLLIIAVPIIIFFIIFAGFTYVTAQGNPEKIKTATRSLTYAIVGAVLILGGVAISEIIASVVESFAS